MSTMERVKAVFVFQTYELVQSATILFLFAHKQQKCIFTMF
jgi:hypothetical protein